jgi:filamentous hemagglutinin family protein
MSKLLSISIYTTCLAFSCFTIVTKTVAQVIQDNTVNTQVTQKGNVSEITGGTTKGSNLFHSFNEFSIPTGKEAFFNNAAAVSNIFSRVTGNNVSNIDGLIRANGTANLYLINPNGIIFGNNARLDIGGSFYGSTGDSILFPNDVEFSASDPTTQPILSINAPIGFSMRDNPGDIINRSVAIDELGLAVGLQVEEGKSITLEGGNISFEKGLVTASGGVTLKATKDIAIAGNGTDFSLNTSSFLGNGGEIKIDSDGGNITLTNSQFNSSSSTDSGGGINIAANQLVSLTDSVFNSFTTSDEGQSGNVVINAGSSIKLIDTTIDAANFGNGKSGNITIEAFNNGTVEFIGQQPESPAEILTDAFGSGEDLENNQSGGNLTVKGGLITIENYQLITRVNKFSDDSFLPNFNTKGNGGDISITGNEIVINNNSSLITQTEGEGAAGSINLDANNILLANNVQLNTNTTAQGTAGIVKIQANNLTLDSSQIIASNTPSEEIKGNDLFGGNISLNLDGNLYLDNNSTISAEATGNADGGNIDLNARFIVALPSQDNGNDIIARAVAGEGGIITINAESLFNIQERKTVAENGTNDIDATSGVGLDGIVSINTPEVDALEGARELPNNVIDVDSVAANTCSASNQTQQNRLLVTGKGGIPPEVTEPFVADYIHTNGAIDDSSDENYSGIELENDTQLVDRKKIVPARGIVVRDDGRIYLVDYPTPNLVTRNLYRSVNCN